MRFDSTYTRYLEQANSQSQRVYRQMPGAEDGRGGVMGTQCLMGTESQFREVKIQETDDGESCTFTFNSVNVLSATELYS